MTFADEDAKWAHSRIQKAVQEDGLAQKELRQLMTESNKITDLRNRLGDIEAQALGLQSDGLGNLSDIATGKEASEEMVKQYEANHEKAILNVPHEVFVDNDMQYKDGKITPIDWKAMEKKRLVSTERE
jgi:hypothetical protein|tara:strand:- start:476 stop:862 length:387 start_codon:yes stop_codon:yes gene_type:complete